MMRVHRILLVAVSMVITFSLPVKTSAAELSKITLEQPQLINNKPLTECLKERQSTRTFSQEPLSPTVLSGLLWTARGKNRDDGKLTVPTACNWQELDVYIAMKEGVYLYDAENHALIPHLEQDLRGIAGEQEFTQEAPVVLLYVADYTKTKFDDVTNQFYAATDTGFMSQNVYLYCASENLATVVLGWFDKVALKKALKLREKQAIILTQPVGYKK